MLCIRYIQAKMESDEKMRVHVIIGIWQGVLDNVEVCSTDEKAAEREKRLCESYEQPYDQEERKKFIEDRGEVKGDIHHCIVEVDATPGE